MALLSSNIVVIGLKFSMLHINIAVFCMSSDSPDLPIVAMTLARDRTVGPFLALSQMPGSISENNKMARFMP